MENMTIREIARQEGVPYERSAEICQRCAQKAHDLLKDWA